MKDSHKYWILVISGFLTLIMTSYFPTEGGGASMIFFITVPFFIILGVVFALVYRLISRKVNDIDIKQITFFLMLFFLIVFALIAYPYDDRMLYSF